MAKTTNETFYICAKLLNVASVCAVVFMVVVGDFPGRWIFGVVLLFIASIFWTAQTYGDVRDEKLPAFPEPNKSSGPKTMPDFRNDVE